MKIYNSLTRTKEEFVPQEPGKVSLYVCGLTPYDAMHIGHLRTFMAYDVIRRYLEYRGYTVTHVQNVTDIDDKIINRSAEVGMASDQLARTCWQEALEELKAIGLLPAHVYPRVTEHVSEIVEMVQGLIEKKMAYDSDGSVYFAVSRFADYGKLSGRTPDEMRAGARVAVDERKEDPLDFALWKSAKEGEPSWESPWGKGRPGWHIECSAMSLKYLGHGFDIHGGANELIFPHHENEVAQSEGYLGKPPFVHYWVHSGVLYVNGVKMSKSLGNFITVKEALSECSPDHLRLLFLTTHYRNPLDYTAEKLEQAKKGIARIRTCLEALERFQGNQDHPKISDVCSQPPETELARSVQETKQRILEAMEDDFNSAQAIGEIFELVTLMNRALTEKEPDPLGLAFADLVLKESLSLLGFSDLLPKVSRPSLEKNLLDLLVELRRLARTDKRWKEADYIREKLAELGVLLEDRADGTTWSLQQ